MTNNHPAPSSPNFKRVENSQISPFQHLFLIHLLRILLPQTYKKDLNLVPSSNSVSLGMYVFFLPLSLFSFRLWFLNNKKWGGLWYYNFFLKKEYLSLNLLQLAELLDMWLTMGTPATYGLDRSKWQTLHDCQ